MSAAKRLKKFPSFDFSPEPPEYPMEEEEEIPFIPSMEEALRNPLVLHKVIHALDFHELLTCRLVNTTWSKISSEVLRKRDCCTVTLRYDRSGNVYRRYSQYGSESGVFSMKSILVRRQLLNALNKILEESKDFPCTDFSFDGGKLDDSEVQKFFRIHGDKVKTLELEGNADEDAKNPFVLKRVLHDILQNKAPNVENLRIENFDYDWTDEEEDQFYLPSLQSFQWLRSSDTVYKILSSSPNLKIVRDIHVGGDVDVLISSGKISTVKEIRCGGYDSQCSVHKFLTACPQLEKLRFLFHSDITSLATSYEKLFEVSKDSLQVLELSEGCSLAGIKFPNLKNLKTLELGVNFGQRCLPCQIHLNETFPNLNKLDCSHLRMYAGWDKFFPSPDAYRGDLPSVKILKIPDGCTKLWMTSLHNLCPNFKQLEIYSEANIPAIIPLVFKLWRHLESIEIEITYVQALVLRGDSDFTGIEEKECWNLLGSGHQRAEGYEKLRINPSICDLKDLKRLRIIFQSGFKSYLMPITSVSGLYGFSLLPKLKVTLEFDHGFDSEGLMSVYKDLAPYANIRHRQAICILPVSDLLLRL